MTLEALRPTNIANDIPSPAGPDIASGSLDVSPVIDITSNDSTRAAVDILYWSSVVVPTFSASANTRFTAKDARLTHVAGLIDAYQVIEKYPDNVFEQERALVERGVEDNGYLTEARDMREHLLPVHGHILETTAQLSYPELLCSVKVAKKKLEKNLGKDHLQFLPEAPEIPHEVVTELATFTSMLEIFKKDAYEQKDELKNEHGRKVDKPLKKKILGDHITGLLLAQAASNMGTTPSGEYYTDRLAALQEKLEERKQEIAVDAPNWTEVQQNRHIREAIKAFNSFEGIFDLKEQTGLTDEMVYDAEKAKNKGLVRSTLWAGSVELAGVGGGWLAGLVQENLIDIKSVVALGIAAGISRGAVLGLLVAKGVYTEKLVDKYGFAPDPFSKWAKEKWGKAWKGFVPYNGILEVGYTGSTVLGSTIVDWPTALIIENIQNSVAIARMSGEVMAMRKAVKEGEKQLTLESETQKDAGDLIPLVQKNEQCVPTEIFNAQDGNTAASA